MRFVPNGNIVKQIVLKSHIRSLIGNKRIKPVLGFIQMDKIIPAEKFKRDQCTAKAQTFLGFNTFGATGLVLKAQIWKIYLSRFINGHRADKSGVSMLLVKIK